MADINTSNQNSKEWEQNLHSIGYWTILDSFDEELNDLYQNRSFQVINLNIKIQLLDKMNW